MSTQPVLTYPESVRKFSINWRTFGLISLVMASLVLCFLWLMAQWNEEQFESGRNSLHIQYQMQLERLIENSSETMIQLSSAVSFNNGLMEAIAQDDREIYEAELEALDWNLQTDSGMSLLGLYNLEWQNLFSYGEKNHEVSARKVAENERAYWHIDCENICRIVTYTALLHQGDVRGVLVLAEPLSNVMLRFQKVANINTGLLGDINQGVDNQIPAWQRSLMALTNPEQSKGIIKQASEDYSLKDLSDGIGLISVKDALYELKAMSLKDNQVVVISDVSEDYNLLHQSKGKTIQISAIALVCGEILLLLFLWRPLRKIKLTEQLEGFAVQQAELLKEKKAALSKAESLSENLCDSLTAAVLVLGKGGEIRFANNYFLKLIGKASNHVLGQPISDFIEGDDKHSSQRISDVYQGLIDEYEHVGRIESRANQVHRMMWRYVPSYFTSEAGVGEAVDRERSIVVIGMPIMLPTLESELEWIDAHDLQTGMLNRQAAYHYIESEVKSLPNVGSVGAIFLFRFGETVFSSSQAEQAYLKLLSTFSVDVKKLSQISHVQLARMDKNEVAVFVRVNQSQTLQVLDSSLLEMLQNMARRFELDLGNVSSSFTQLGENTYPPHTVFQALQSKL